MLDIAPVPANDVSSRWEGKRLIDYFLISNIPDLFAEAQSARISDRKIFQISVQVKLGSLRERRFKKSLQLDKPSWISNDKWKTFLAEAYHAEEIKQWKEAAHVAGMEDPGPTPHSDEVVVDLQWNWFQAKYLCVLRTAFFLSLLCIHVGRGLRSLPLSRKQPG